jgi:hypothetical protein
MAHAQLPSVVRHALNKQKRKGSFVISDLPPPAGTRNCSSIPEKKKKKGKADEIDQKPRRSRVEIREPGVLVVLKTERWQVGMGTWSLPQKGGAPQGPGKGVTVWVALGVQNKGWVGVEFWEGLGLQQMV